MPDQITETHQLIQKIHVTFPVVWTKLIFQFRNINLIRLSFGVINPEASYRRNKIQFGTTTRVK